MKVLVYADFRSPHARGWREGIESAGIEVLAISSEMSEGYDAVQPEDAISARRQTHLDRRRVGQGGVVSMILKRASGLQVSHTTLNLLRMRAQRRRLRRHIAEFRPDVIHALRIPYEGLTALGLGSSVPVVVSTWGSDFVPMAAEDPLLRLWTRRMLRRAAGIQTDSRQDLLRAREHGLPLSVPSFYSAANFGVDDRLFYPDTQRAPGTVVYPRKAKANANYRGFVEAALRLTDRPRTRFVAVGLREIAEELARDFGPSVIERIELTDPLSREEMSALMRSADVVVSPTYWDGTPITILEAVACGASVVAGDLPELRTLASDGLAIDLIDASDTDEIVAGIERGLARRDPARIAASLPPQFDRAVNRTRIGEFYAAVASR